MHRQGLAARNGLDCRLGLESCSTAWSPPATRSDSGKAATGSSTVELAQLRSSTLDALVAYAEALDSLAWPVPREVLQQIQLRRSLLSMPVSRGPAVQSTAAEG